MSHSPKRHSKNLPVKLGKSGKKATSAGHSASHKWLHTAVEHHKSGRLQDAQQFYRKILATQPNHPDALHLLGVAKFQCGDYSVAIEYITRALTFNPNWPEAHSNLGNALRGQGRLDEAVSALRRALELKPDFADAFNNLGVALNEQGNQAEAVLCYRRALELAPGYADALTNLGCALEQQRKLDEAIVCHRRALELAPNHAVAHTNLGCVLERQEKLDEAILCYRRALELNPAYPAAYVSLGYVLVLQGKLDEAIRCYRRALELRPDYTTAHSNLGNALLCQGKFDEAVPCYRRILQYMLGDNGNGQVNGHESVAVREPSRDYRANYTELHMAFSNAVVQLVTILGSRIPEEDLLAMQGLLSSPKLRGDNFAALHFALAQVFDSRGDHATAAKHLNEANPASRALLQEQNKYYGPLKYKSMIDDVCANCTKEFFTRTSGFGLETEQPVFIIGLPRSGTTLVEQILASHSRVFGAGELPHCEQTLKSLPGVMNASATPLACLHRIDQKTAHDVASRYLGRLRSIAPEALRIVDKMPENFPFLGLIRVLFPKARVIHCRRDLRDVALSCWMTSFNFVPWAYDQDDIVSHVEDYLRVMDHWETTLPSPSLNVDYEELVADTERVARRVIEWCGLTWESECLSFYRTQRPVQTASVIQVRRPIYQSSVNRWRNYEPWLAELFSRVHQLETTWRSR